MEIMEHVVPHVWTTSDATNTAATQDDGAAEVVDIVKSTPPLLYGTIFCSMRCLPVRWFRLHAFPITIGHTTSSRHSAPATALFTVLFFCLQKL